MIIYLELSLYQIQMMYIHYIDLFKSHQQEILVMVMYMKVNQLLLIQTFI